MSSTDFDEYMATVDDPTMDQQYMAQIAKWLRNIWIMLHPPESRKDMQYGSTEDMLLTHTPPTPKKAEESMEDRIARSKAIRLATLGPNMHGKPKTPPTAPARPQREPGTPPRARDLRSRRWVPKRPGK